MYRINYTGRPVLSVHDEILFHMPSDKDIGPRQIIQNIIVAEERWIAPALGDKFYYDFVDEKNVKVTTSNQATLLAQINASLTAAGKPTITVSTIPVGTRINAIEMVTNTHYVELWEMFLSKIVAEAVDIATTVPSWLRHTAQGQQKNNPEVIGGSGKGSATGDRRDVQFKIDHAVQSRLDPLLARMHLWICNRKENFPLYKKECDCDNPEGVSYKRKSDWVFVPDTDSDCDDCKELNWKESN